MSGDPLLGTTLDGDKRLKVIETERSAIAPCAGLILEWAREGRCEERTILAAILPDRGFDVAATQRVRGFVVGSHLVSSFVEMKLALSRERGEPMHISQRKHEAGAVAGVPERNNRRE